MQPMPAHSLAVRRSSNSAMDDSSAITGMANRLSDAVPAGKYGQAADRIYGKGNVLRRCRAEGNALYGAALMVLPQDVDESNTFSNNGKGPLKK